MSTTANVGDLVFLTPAVKGTVKRRDSRKGSARLDRSLTTTQIGPEEAEFIAARDSFYLANISGNSWPFTQYRRGPKGFLRMVDATTLGLAAFRADRQHISTGNVLLFLTDYASRGCLKIWAQTEISEDPAVIERLSDRSYGATIDRAFLFRVLALEWNCQQSIVQ
jgi:uncharacterized protein